MDDYSVHNLTVSVSPAPSASLYEVATFAGDLDKSGLASVKERLESLAAQFSGRYLVFDFSQLNFINSEGIGFLMMIHTRLAKAGKSLVIVNAKPNVKDVFSVIGLLQVIEYFDSLENLKAKHGK